MPEVVYAKNNQNWDEVFPIWKIDGTKEGGAVNNILYQLALNNRFAGKAPKAALKIYLEQITNNVKNLLDENLKALQKCDDPDEIKKLIERRNEIFRQYGEIQFYIPEVLSNLGGAYRAYKG